MQCLHSRRERGVLGQAAISRSLRLPGAGRSGQRGAEPHQLVPQVSLRDSRALHSGRGWAGDVMLRSDSDSDRFVRAKQFIDEAILSGGRVLVHCNGGISLSPAFVVMYVMQYYQMSWEDALHMVQNRRYCISPNGGFLTQIKVSSFFRRRLYIDSELNVECRSMSRYTRRMLL